MKEARKKIRVVIVDDEKIARRGLRTMLQAESDFQVVAECSNGIEALGAIRKRKPELVLLDIQMPELDGLGVIRALPVHEVPFVIFVTAYDRYAIDAFEAHALDYLLKPFGPDRLRRALERAKKEILLHEGFQSKITKLLGDISRNNNRQSEERLLVKVGGKLILIKVDDIDWIEAAGDYVKLHVKGDHHVLREKMYAMEAKLEKSRFLRIHKSTIINLSRLKELRPLFYGDYSVILSDGTKLSMSRTHRHRLRQLLGKPL